MVDLFIASLKKHISKEDYTAIETCLGCRNCGSGCAWYLATGDETLHPKYKKDFIRKAYYRHIHPIGKLITAIGLASPITEDTLRHYMPYFWKCTTCGRCTLSCPLGLSNMSIVRLARTAFSDSGLILENPVLEQVYKGSRDIRHSFAIPKEKLMARYYLFFTHENIIVPFDVQGADFLYAASAVENTRFPDYGIKIPKIFNAAGVSYTFSSRLTDTGTDIEHVVVQRELSREMLEDIEREADRLNVKKVVISECGCDVRTFYIEAGAILGRPFKHPVQSIDSLMLELIESGALPIEKIQDRITFHDPCKVVRLAGMGSLERKLLNLVAEEIIEMSPNGAYNYCCNGGTGPLRLPENTKLRREISWIKANQIRTTGAQRVVTPCAVCMLTLEDICQTYNLPDNGQRMSFMTFELVYEAMQRGLDKIGESNRIQAPAIFLDKTPEYISEHSISGVWKNISIESDMHGVLHWLSEDAVTARYLKSNQGAHETMQEINAQLTIIKQITES